LPQAAAEVVPVEIIGLALCLHIAIAEGSYEAWVALEVD
jgi:hypothetical protein